MGGAALSCFCDALLVRVGNLVEETRRKYSSAKALVLFWGVMSGMDALRCTTCLWRSGRTRIWAVNQWRVRLKIESTGGKIDGGANGKL